MLLHLKSITREGVKLVFKETKILKAEYNENKDLYYVYDKEFKIACSSDHPINILEEYGNKIYELYLLFNNADTSKMDDQDLYLYEKIKALKVFHNR